MRRLLAAAAALSALLAAPAGAASTKALTVTFAGTGGTEVATGSFSLRTSPVCQLEGRLRFTATDVAWRAKFNHVPVPPRGRTVTRTAQATLTGTGHSRSEFRADSGCGSSGGQEPPQDCTAQLRMNPMASLRLGWSRGRLRVQTLLFPDDEDEEAVDEPVEEPPDEGDCPNALRRPAFRAAARVPRTGRRMRVTRVDHTVNAAGPDDTRSHFESSESSSEGGTSFSSRYVSDVTWGGVVTVRYHRP